MEQPPSKETRVPVNLRIKFRSETIEQFVERYAIDVSRGGIFIRTREPLAVGTQLRFDFQLQDTSPLMAGEGTVVWIREHDPTRAGVTPGMGVRFDKLTPASQPVLDKILADKGRREPSGPVSTSTTSVSATASGKSGATSLPVRRPSSTFSAVDPATLGTPQAGTPATGLGTPLPAAAATPAFGAATAAGGAQLASQRPTGAPIGAGLAAKAGQPSTPVLKSPNSGAGALPTLETQSALGRLATGPNLSTFGGVGSAPRTKSPLPLLRPPLGAGPGDTSPTAMPSAGAPSIPTPVEDSERTQIADGLPDFSSEPTHVGGPALGITETGSGRTATITATSKRVPTPASEARLSLDQGMSHASAGDAAGAAAGVGAVASPGMAPARTTSPDGSTNTTGAGGTAPVAGRLSGSQAVVLPVGATEPPRDFAPLQTPGGSRAVSASRSLTPMATPRVDGGKKRPTVFIIVGVLAGAVAATVIATRVSNHEVEAPVVTGPAATPPAPEGTTPAAAANPVAANPTPAGAEGTKTEPSPTAAAAGPPPSAETKPGEAKLGEAKVGEIKPAEAKPGEAKPREAKVAEAKVAEAKPADTKPSEAKPAVAEAPAPSAKAGAKKQRPLPRRKGGALAKSEPSGDMGGEAVEAASAADAAVGNVARVMSTPSGAEVLIDGQSVGKTPYQGKDVDPAAPHALTVRKDGFETYEHMVSTSDWIKGKGAGQSLRVMVKLRKAHGAGESEGAGEKKPEKATEPAAESAKTEPAPAESP